MKRIVLLPLAALVLAGGAPAPKSEAGSTVTITVTNLRNAKGLVQACMMTSAKSFPKCENVDKALTASVAARKDTLSLTFKNVKPGQYAIALLHDENANGKADRVLGMMPKEGFGFSRDAPVRMGPPKFDEAMFDLGSEDHAMTIKMRYLL